MVLSQISNLLDAKFWTTAWVLIVTLFQRWMLIDAVRRREWIWAIFILLGFGLAAVLYFFFVYRDTLSATRGFELPGAFDRRRIKELQARIHHLDKAHLYSELGDIYFQHGKLARAEEAYRAALAREPDELDTQAHLGQCLLRQKRSLEARPLLERVVTANPRHDYGHTMMALAETLTALGEREAAMGLWKQVTEEHTYPRAKVQLAELYLSNNQTELARAELRDVVADDIHAPAFQRRRDRHWVRRARRLARTLN